jgi:hypothetical protein
MLRRLRTATCLLIGMRPSAPSAALLGFDIAGAAGGSCDETKGETR